MFDDLDITAPYFRRAMNRWPEAQTLTNHYEAVADSYQGNQHGLIETIKSFVECVCLTILGEHGKTMPSSTPSTTETLVEALKILGLKESRGTRDLNKLLSAHNKLANALTAMRNHNTPVAHGKDGFIDVLTKNHTRIYLLAADTLLALLLAALEGKDPDLEFTREPYDNFAHLHNRIDRSVVVESSVECDEDDVPLVTVSFKTGSLSDGVDLKVEPSKLLYSLDRIAYIELLEASSPQLTTVTEKWEAAEGLPSSWADEGEPTPEFATSYSGPLSSLRGPLQEYMVNLGLPESTALSADANLVDSILKTAEANMGTDWANREALQARMKVSLRRTLARFGISDGDVKDWTQHLVTWFKIQAAHIPGDSGEDSDGQ